MRRRSSLALAGCFAVLGFLLVTAASTTSATRKAEAPRRAQLIDLIEERRDDVAQRDREVRDLRDRVVALQRDLARRTAQDQAAAEKAERLAMEAGTVALQGRGLLIRLSDSEREPDDPAQAGAYRVHDTDIQLMVNALFAAGAEAIAVNDSRLVATTPIRAAGDTIVVNFRPLAPPYRIAAIGADRTRFDDSEVATRFRRWVRLFGLGFSVSERTVDVPAYTGRVGISSAQPVPPAAKETPR